MKTLAALALIVCCAVTAGAVDKGKAAYVGGTIEIPGVKEKDQAPISLKSENAMTYGKDSKGLEIPWTSVKDVEYGEKVSHRIKTAIFLSPVSLFHKSRHHFVTVTYDDAKAAEQAVVFEFDASDIRMALASFRARTGKEITFQDEEARKQMGGGLAGSARELGKAAATPANRAAASAVGAAADAAPAPDASPTSPPQVPPTPRLR